MQEPGGEGTPQQHLSSEKIWREPGLSHEQLVAGFRDYIKQHQEAYAQIRSPKERPFIPPQEIIRKRLDIQSGSINHQEGEFYSTLRYAWDALVYDHYEPGSLAENLAGYTLSMYYQATREPTIKLTQGQTRIIDALAEAADIPTPKGQSVIEIDERHRNRTKWVLSKEYEERLARASARAKGESPEEPKQIQSNIETSAGHHPPAERDPFYESFWNDMIERSAHPPSGQDPAWWPMKMLFELEDLPTNRHLIKDKARAALAEKLAPIQDDIRRIRMAYGVVAYPSIKYEGWRDLIESQLRTDAALHRRDHIELSDTEAEILHRLCEVPRYAMYRNTKTLQPRIPFDPDQRVYRYSEVLHPRNPIPKALNSAEFIAYQAREAKATEISSGKK